MLIGITGSAGSGKSTVADFMVREYDFIRMRFANPLKAMLHSLLAEAGVDLLTATAMIDGDKKGDVAPHLNWQTARHAMQTLGTEWGRNCMGDKFWVNLAENKLVGYSDRRVVFDDVRFEDEAAMIRDNGGTIIHLTGRGGISGSHPSEAGVVRHQNDVVVHNDGSVTKLHVDVADIIWRAIEPVSQT